MRRTAGLLGPALALVLLSSCVDGLFAYDPFGRDAKACERDADCGGQFCEVATGLCRACVTDAHCGDDAKACLGGACALKPDRCDADGDCAAGSNPYCDTSTRRCIGCRDTADCGDAAKACFEGACRELETPASPTLLGLVLTPATGAVTMTFEAPSSAQAPVASIEVLLDGGSVAALPPTATSHTFTDLTPGTSHLFGVRSTNAAGSSPRVTSSQSAPVAPADVVVVPSPGASPSLSLSWSPVASEGVSGYVIHRSGPSGFTFVDTATTTAWVDTGLEAGVDYVYRVYARTGALLGAPSVSATATAIVPPVEPSIQGVVLTPADGAVTMTFAAPASRQAPVDEVTLLLDGAEVVSLPATAISYSFQGLEPGTAHVFGLRSSNAAGKSAVALSPQAPPPAPTGLTATPTPGASGSLSLSWDPVVSPAVAGYVVHREDSSGLTFLGTTASPSFTDAGLSPGSVYTYRVSARSAALSSAPSAAASATAIEPPAVPSIVELRRGSGTVEMRFTVPQAPAAPVSSVRVFLDGAEAASLAPSATAYTFTGLTPGASYVFGLRSENVAGPSALVTSAQRAPAAPTGLSVAPTPGSSPSLALSWSPVVSAGVLGYIVERSRPSGATVTFTTSAPPFVDSGLTAGETFTYRVAAFTSALVGAASPAVSATAIAPPASPSILALALAPASGVVTMTYAAPSSAAAPVAAVTVLLDGAAVASLAGASGSHAFTSLAPGDAHKFGLRSSNPAGPSPTVELLETPPPGVTGLAVASAPGAAATLRLTWAAAAGAVGYVVQHRSADGTFVSIGTPAANEWTDAALDPTTSHTYRVAAFGHALLGAFSATASGTPANVPGPPTITAVTGRHRRLVVAFDAPLDDGGLPVSNVEYSVDDGAGWTARLPASTASPLDITGLVNGTSYRVRIRAVNALGAGAASPAFTASPVAFRGSGGQETKELGSWRYHVFTTSGDLVVNDESVVEVMLAGAGGGGYFGGGGGGGVIPFTAASAVTGPCSVVVGTRGADNFADGRPSSFTCGGTTLTALGGGSGGGPLNGYNGRPGGSGGGAYVRLAGYAGGAGTPGQGRDGASSGPSAFCGGGGGGYAEAGRIALARGMGGAGWPLSNVPDLASLATLAGMSHFGSGGGGCGDNMIGGSNGAGGPGAGHGAYIDYSFTNATAFGGGGGGIWERVGPSQIAYYGYAGGLGANGVVVVRYPRE